MKKIEIEDDGSIHIASADPEATKKAIRSEMNFEFEKRLAIENAEQERKNTMVQQEKQKQKVILGFVCLFLIVVIVFASFMFKRWRTTQKQKQIIEKQKEKIVDSINYAQRIQHSILKDESEIRNNLPNSFIYFQPKDIVSGDFYWCSKIGDKVVIAAVDCTGHGIPGAFMSMIGNTLLNEIVNEKHITTPSHILELLNLGIYKALNQEKDGALSDDGMDLGLCCIDYGNHIVQYAGAQNTLYVLSDGQIETIKGDIHGIGGGMLAKIYNPVKKEYTNHILPVKKDMCIYLFSDGYVDQFGGPGRKKFGAQRFKELLLNNQHLEMQKQKEVIVLEHLKWKGDGVQIDDILVIGIKV